MQGAARKLVSYACVGGSREKFRWTPVATRRETYIPIRPLPWVLTEETITRPVRERSQVPAIVVVVEYKVLRIDHL
jgi:hypothetical protein